MDVAVRMAVGVEVPQAPPVTLISTEVMVLVPVYPTHCNCYVADMPIDHR
jgi:hypothetical protein